MRVAPSRPPRSGHRPRRGGRDAPVVGDRGSAFSTEWAVAGGPDRAGDPAPESGVQSRLRGDAGRRRQVDPGLAGGLREWLEDGVGPAASDLPAGIPAIVLGPRSLSAALGEVPEPRGGDGPVSLSTPIARSRLVAALFRQLVTTGRIEDPMTDALDALASEPSNGSLLSFIDALDDDEGEALRSELAEHATGLVARWPALPPAWLPRTHDRIVVPLAGGRILLATVVDLVLGSPSSGRASVCLMNLVSGERRTTHPLDRQFRGLLETLRSGAPPARLATLYSPSCEIDADEVCDPMLAHAVQRVICGAVELCQRVAEGAQR